MYHIMNTHYLLNEIYKKFRDEYKFILFSNEIEKSKPATLLFLAKTGILIDNISFYPLEDYTTIWKESDIIISGDMNILKMKPTDKFSIKFTTGYNEESESDETINSLKDLLENDYFTRPEFA